MQEGAPERGEHQYLPEDFLLHEGSTNIGGTVYYSLCSPKLPGRELALRVNTLDCILRDCAGEIFLCFSLWVELQERSSQASVSVQVSVRSSLVLPVQKSQTPGVVFVYVLVTCPGWTEGLLLSTLLSFETF